MLNKVLKELRKKKGLTQEQLAHILAVERSSVGKYESPTSPITPSSDVLIRMSDFFAVSIDELLGKERKPPQGDITLSDFDYALFGEVRELDDEDKAELLKHAQLFNERRKLRKQNEGRG